MILKVKACMKKHWKSSNICSPSSPRLQVNPVSVYVTEGGGQEWVRSDKIWLTKSTWTIFWWTCNSAWLVFLWWNFVVGWKRSCYLWKCILGGTSLMLCETVNLVSTVVTVLLRQLWLQLCGLFYLGGDNLAFFYLITTAKTPSNILIHKSLQHLFLGFLSQSPAREHLSLFPKQPLLHVQTSPLRNRLCRSNFFILNQ